MPQSFAYILNRRPFRESSQLVDIFTEDHGNICCVARPAKKRGKILKGNLEPFRYLYINWIGKGDVQTLTEADERGRHKIPPSEMMLGLYLNELLLLLTRQHVAQPELFSAYKYTLHKLADPSINRQIMMRFELYLLANLGYPLALQTDQAILSEMRYLLTQDEGLIMASDKDIDATRNLVCTQAISGELLIALQDLPSMQAIQWKQLRQYLDAVFKDIAPRKINSRQLLNI
ncbi:MAG: DNA repair protein RecO [Cocleimonas sp.]